MKLEALSIVDVDLSTAMLALSFPPQPRPGGHVDQACCLDTLLFSSWRDGCGPVEQPS